MSDWTASDISLVFAFCVLPTLYLILMIVMAIKEGRSNG